MPWARRIPGATASMNSRTECRARRVIQAPTSVPSAIPPHTPRPPCHTAKIPRHFGSGTSFQLVMSW